MTISARNMIKISMGKLKAINVKSVVNCGKDVVFPKGGSMIESILFDGSSLIGLLFGPKRFTPLTAIKL
jgi:hypothetical protein